jgi:hypothetical protein
MEIQASAGSQVSNLNNVSKSEQGKADNASFRGALLQFIEERGLKPSIVSEALSGSRINFWKDKAEAGRSLKSISDCQAEEIEKTFLKIANLLKERQ